MKYIYYVLFNMNLNKYSKGGGQPLVTGGALKKIVVPIPSIEEQEKIVHILDCFNSVCNDMVAGLPAEMEGRHKQYEYYRDKLLTFKEKAA